LSGDFLSGSLHIRISRDNQFFERPILNSPYACPARYRELDEHSQPAQRFVESRRRAQFITPVPKPRKQKASAGGAESSQREIEGKGLSSENRQCDAASTANRRAALFRGSVAQTAQPQRLESVA